MTPTDILREEHRVILRALELLETAARRLDCGAPLPDGWLAQLVAWLRGFADRNHHAKEETALFPAMVKAGVPSMGGPIGIMLEEHERGRGLIHGLEAVDPSVQATAAREYVAMLREHIEKENGVLFPLADAVLDETARRAVGRELESLEAEQGGETLTTRAEAGVERLQSALEA